MICVLCNRCYKHKKNYITHLDAVHNLSLDGSSTKKLSPKIKLKNTSSQISVKNQSTKVDLFTNIDNDLLDEKFILHREVSCEFCDKKFYNVYSLRRHIDSKKCKSLDLLILEQRIKD